MPHVNAGIHVKICKKNPLIPQAALGSSTQMFACFLSVTRKRVIHMIEKEQRGPLVFVLSISSHAEKKTAHPQVWKSN